MIWLTEGNAEAMEDSGFWNKQRNLARVTNRCMYASVARLTYFLHLKGAEGLIPEFTGRPEHTTVTDIGVSRSWRNREEKEMAQSASQPVSISLSKFTESVQAAVKAAVAKHPKLKVEAPNAITISYLIRGIPAPESILANVSLGEMQAFANEVASQIASTHPEALAAGRGAGAEGAILAIGRHVIIGIPPALQTVRLER